MWTDNETALDLIGFRVHADLIRSVVQNPKLLPVTIGLFGDWGGGKTSLMKIIQRDLDPENWPDKSPERIARERLACLYFNGWLFEGYDDAKSAILSSILVELGEHKRLGPKIRDKAVSLLKSVNWMRVARLGLKHVALPAMAAFVSGGASLVPALAGAVGELLPWKKRQSDTSEGGKESEPAKKHDEIDWEGLLNKDTSPAGPTDVRSFREQFGLMLKDCDIDALVVLIDDLDRCSPERIVENLEAIKLFLNVENTAFVIGADPRIVRHAIAWKYKQYGEVRDGADGEASDRLVTDYLEKLIQYPYRLPRLSPAEIETYMALLFCEVHLSEDDFTHLVQACEAERVKNRYAVFGYAAIKDALVTAERKEPTGPLAKALAFCTAAAPLITEGLKGNPRQVKRFLNAFVMRKQLAEVARLTNIEDAVLVKLMILEYSQDSRFRQLHDWQAVQEGQPKELAALEAAVRPPDGTAENEEGAKKAHADWGSAWVRRWLASDPPLSGIDLRDYFWVARDRLQTTLSGLSLVPPLVRRTFEDLMAANPAKMRAAVAAIRGFPQDEREGVFRLLARHVGQKVGEKAGFDAARMLVEADVTGAAEVYGKLFTANPPDDMNPAAGTDLVALAAAKAEVSAILAPAIERLRATSSRIGKAVQKAVPVGRK